MGLSEDLRNVGATITTGEAKSLRLEGLRNEFVHDGKKVTYEIKIGKFGPYILSSLKDDNGKDLMRSIPPTMFPGTFTDSDAESLIFPSEEAVKTLYGKYNLKKGRYGDYFERIGDGATVTWPKALKTKAENAGEDYIELLFSLPLTLGCDSDGNPVVLKVGPYGFYAQYNGKNVKVTDPLNVKTEDIVSPHEAGAVKGEFEGKPLSLASGRYGLYIKWGDENIRLSQDDRKNPEGLTLERLKEIVSSRTKESGKKTVEAEREFTDVEGIKPLLVSGRYGYYIKWGEENVALPSEEKADPSSLTDERVMEIIAEHKTKPKTTRRFVRRKK